MRFLISEKLGPHKYKTPEGYLVCVDAILSRTGTQEYRRCELFGDACDDPDKTIMVDRKADEVFSDKTMASFENKAICIEHPKANVNVENHNDLSVGFVRDIHRGEDNDTPVMMGTLVITDKEAVEAVESGEYKELSCGYDCDIEDEHSPQQRNIRGNHVALCKQGRAGIARIVDSVDDIAIKVWQVRQGYAIVVKRYWKQYGRNAFVDATEPSIEAAIYHRGSLERNDKMEFVIVNCNDGKYNIEDEGMKDIQTTKTPGTDKIIYVMQSDIDKNLYFYIGKTFSMKEGEWGYTKFEMGNDTPEKIKAELTRNGWHQVASGPAGIIDASNEDVALPKIRALGKWEWDEVKCDWYDTGRKMYLTEIERNSKQDAVLTKDAILKAKDEFKSGDETDELDKINIVNGYVKDISVARLNKREDKLAILLGKITDYVKANGPLTVEELAKQFRMSRSDMQSHLAQLCSNIGGVKQIRAGNDFKYIGDASQNYTFKLAKRKNDYDEFVIKAYLDGKYNEGATYYTDDWEDAVGTLKAMSKQYGLSVKQKGSSYTADAAQTQDTFTIEYVKDNITHIVEIEAKTIADAVIKAKTLSK